MTPTLHLVFIFPCEDCSLFVNCSVFQTIPEVLGRKGQVWLVIWIYFNIKFRSACITGAQSIAVGWETEKYYGFKFRYVTNSTVSSLSLSEKCSESVSHSVVSNSLWLHGPTMEFSGKNTELSPGDLPDPGMEPGSPAWQACPLLSEPPGKTLKSQGSPLVGLPRWCWW